MSSALLCCGCAEVRGGGTLYDDDANGGTSFRRFVQALLRRWIVRPAAGPVSPTVLPAGAVVRRGGAGGNSW